MSEDEPFDYGEKRDDGQYENYPTVDEGDFVNPVRYSYIHEKCGDTTRMSTELAESLARDPDYYSKAFCVSCGSHFPLEEFEWVKDGEEVGT